LTDNITQRSNVSPLSVNKLCGKNRIEIGNWIFMSPKTSSAREWDKQAATWDKGIHSSKWPHFHYYKTFDIYLTKLLINCKKVLELGCGTADSTINFAADTDELTATDFSKEMIRVAARKLAITDVINKVHLAVSEAQNLPFRDEYFHGVFSRGSLLNYVICPESFLREIHRVLIRGGQLVIDMISRKPGGEAVLYSTSQVKRMLKNVGFTSVCFRPIGIFLLLWTKPDLMDFVNKHRDTFCKIEVEMEQAFKPKYSTMTLIQARKHA
jgi:SAM-dependent methyltransferase